MAEIVAVGGFVISAISLAAEGIKLTESITSFVDKIRIAPSEVRALAEDVRATSSTLEELAADLDTDREAKVSESWFSDTKSHMNGCRKVFNEIREWLKISCGDAADMVDSAYGKRDRVKLAFSMDKISRLRGDVDRVKRDFTFKLTILILTRVTGDQQAAEKRRAAEKEMNARIDALELEKQWINVKQAHIKKMGTEGPPKPRVASSPRLLTAPPPNTQTLPVDAEACGQNDNADAVNIAMPRIIISDTNAAPNVSAQNLDDDQKEQPADSGNSQGTQEPHRDLLATVISILENRAALHHSPRPTSESPSDEIKSKLSNIETVLERLQNQISKDEHSRTSLFTQTYNSAVLGDPAESSSRSSRQCMEGGDRDHGSGGMDPVQENGIHRPGMPKPSINGSGPSRRRYKGPRAESLTNNDLHGGKGHAGLGRVMFSSDIEKTSETLQQGHEAMNNFDASAEDLEYDSMEDNVVTELPLHGDEVFQSEEELANGVLTPLQVHPNGRNLEAIVDSASHRSDQSHTEQLDGPRLLANGSSGTTIDGQEVAVNGSFSSVSSLKSVDAAQVNQPDREAAYPFSTELGQASQNAAVDHEADAASQRAQPSKYPSAAPPVLPENNQVPAVLSIDDLSIPDNREARVPEPSPPGHDVAGPLAAEAPSAVESLSVAGPWIKGTRSRWHKRVWKQLSSKVRFGRGHPTVAPDSGSRDPVSQKEIQNDGQDPDPSRSFQDVDPHGESRLFTNDGRPLDTNGPYLRQMLPPLDPIGGPFSRVTADGLPPFTTNDYIDPFAPGTSGQRLGPVGTTPGRADLRNPSPERRRYNASYSAFEAWSLRRTEKSAGTRDASWISARRIHLPITQEEMAVVVKQYEKDNSSVWEDLSCLSTYQQRQIERLLIDKQREDDSQDCQWAVKALKRYPDDAQRVDITSLQIIIQKHHGFGFQPSAAPRRRPTKSKRRPEPAHSDSGSLFFDTDDRSSIMTDIDVRTGRRSSYDRFDPNPERSQRRSERVQNSRRRPPRTTYDDRTRYRPRYPTGPSTIPPRSDQYFTSERQELDLDHLVSRNGGTRTVQRENGSAALDKVSGLAARDPDMEQVIAKWTILDVGFPLDGRPARQDWERDATTSVDPRTGLVKYGKQDQGGPTTAHGLQGTRGEQDRRRRDYKGKGKADAEGDEAWLTNVEPNENWSTGTRPAPEMPSARLRWKDTSTTKGNDGATIELLGPY